MRVEDAGQVEADAGVAAGDDEDAAGLVGEVLFGEGGRREAEGLAGEGAECGHFEGKGWDWGFRGWGRRDVFVFEESEC